MIARRTMWSRAMPVLAIAIAAALALALVGCRGGAASEGISPMPSVAPPTSGAGQGAPDIGAVADETGGRYADRQGGESLSYGGASDGRSEDAGSPRPGDRLIVRDKTLRLRVENAETAVKEARKLATSFGGTIESVQLASDAGPIYRMTPEGSPTSDGSPLGGFVTVRVPVARFDAFVKEATGLGRVLSEAESAEDVTQQHVDLTARLKNLKAEATRLRALFAKAETVTDMLKVEAELSRVQGEIESMQAQVTFLERRAAMATVTLELVEPEPIVRPSGTDWGFGEALRESLRAFVGSVNGLVVFAGWVAPFAILAVLAALAVRSIVRRRRRRGLPPRDVDPEPLPDAE